MLDNDTIAKSLGLLLACAVAGLIVFLILRELMCWYYKINRIVSLLEDIKDSLPHRDKATVEEPDKVEPKNAVDSFNKGIDLLENGKPAEAVELFDEALETEPQDSDTWFWKGEGLLRLGSHEEALACFERAAAFNSTDPKPLYGKARALDELGRTEKAAKFYSEYLAKAPKDDEWTDVARRRLKEIERTAGH